MDEIANNLPPAKKAQLHEVADGLLKIYRTLARMRYIEDSWIQEAPYANLDTQLLPMWKSYDNIDAEIIYLWSILPYLTYNASRALLPHFQRFLDFRKKKDVQNRLSGKSPIPPHMTHLFTMAQYVGDIFYDSKQHKIAIYGLRLDGDFSGYDLGGTANNEDNQEEIEKADKEEKEEGDSESGTNTNRYAERMKNALPADKVLQEMHNWLLDTNVTPGGSPYSTINWPEDVIKPLYVKHGWPGLDFDGNAFLVDLVRTRAIERIKYFATLPLHKIKDQKSRVKALDPTGTRLEELKKTISEAKTVDEEWLARWELFSTERQKNIEEMALARMEEEFRIECPDGKCVKEEELPIMELKTVASMRSANMKVLEEIKKMLERAPNRWSELEGMIRVAEQEIEIHNKAFEASKSDFDRLYPGLPLVDPSFEERDEGLEERMMTFQKSWRAAEDKKQELRDWAARVPDEAVSAKQKVQESIDELERAFEEKVRITVESWKKKKQQN
ncbi:hypothetical protein QBC38DRAFT_545641 [Podospora fimiseda]|uniref:Uncharacterized protein n=1 Tax=Podospora fimiseda TaxID=252190 RepID=A0AAN7BNZ2_9PEZI|nr:hypothetical protein QBC38DRAFT_545641 [Podospora fimiseda]